MIVRAASFLFLLSVGPSAAFTCRGPSKGIGSVSTTCLLQPSAVSSIRVATTTSRRYRSSGARTTHPATSLNVDSSISLESSITPEGFGFSTPASRILDRAGRNNGYYKAKGSDIVTDVMEGITSGKADVAVVFDENDSSKVSGIFTETDYIKVCFFNSLLCIGLTMTQGIGAEPFIDDGVSSTKA
jgi:hypothetical protein